MQHLAILLINVWLLLRVSKIDLLSFIYLCGTFVMLLELHVIEFAVQNQLVLSEVKLTKKKKSIRQKLNKKLNKISLHMLADGPWMHICMYIYVCVCRVT